MNKQFIIKKLSIIFIGLFSSFSQSDSITFVNSSPFRLKVIAQLCEYYNAIKARVEFNMNPSSNLNVDLPAKRNLTIIFGAHQKQPAKEALNLYIPVDFSNESKINFYKSGLGWIEATRLKNN